MKVFVTGAAGFLGSWVAERLIEDGHMAVGVDNLIGGEVDNVPKGCYGDFTGKASILDLAKMTELCQGCDAVVHCAALAYEGLSVFSPSMIVENIVSGTVTVATAAIKAGVKRFVNCSSMARYGNALAPFTEMTKPQPVDPYGAAKLAAEKQLDLLGSAHGMTAVHAVPHNIYGPRQCYIDVYRNVAAIMANLMLQGKNPIVYGDGKQTRCFSYVGDVLPVLVQLVTADVDHGEIFNVGPDEDETTINELVEVLSDITGARNLNPVHVPGRPCEVKHAVCSSDKIRNRFGYRTQTSLYEGMTALVNYIKDSGPRPFKYHLDLEIVTDKTPKTWTERMF